VGDEGKRRSSDLVLIINEALKGGEGESKKNGRIGGNKRGEGRNTWRKLRLSLQ